jgi:hypothetical protein
VLTANGSLDNGNAAPLRGAVTVRLSGGDLPSEIVRASTASGGFVTPVGPLVRWMDRPNATPGRSAFSAFVRLPGATRNVTATGLYLPKSRRAVAYFPGTTVGGFLEVFTP